MMANHPFKDPEKIGLLSLSLLIIAIGVTGNVLVLLAVWKKRWLRSTTNYLLANLAASDLTTLLSCIPMVVPESVDLKEGTLADFLCKFLISFHVPLTAGIASILTLVVLAVERYLAVVKPMKTGIRLREETVKYANFGVWAAAFLLTLPIYMSGHYRRTTSSSHCSNTSNNELFKVYTLFLATVSIIFPFITISFCYFQIVRELYFKNKVEPQNVAAEEDARSKRKLIKLSLTITSVFVVCFFPLAITVAMKFVDNKPYGKYCQKAAFFFVAGAAINPIIYSFQSINFRQAFKEVLRCS